MNSVAAPVHEATVSSELRHLLVACRHGSGLRSEPHVAAEAPGPVPEEAGQAPWVQLSLRRDGARPLRVRGLLIHKTEVRAPDGSRLLQLFATAGGGAVAQLAYEPAEGLAMRPVFRAEPVRDADELRVFIDREAPDQGRFPCGEEPVTDVSPPPRALLRLPSALPGLVRPHHLRPLRCEGNRS